MNPYQKHIAHLEAIAIARKQEEDLITIYMMFWEMKRDYESFAGEVYSDEEAFAQFHVALTDHVHNMEKTRDRFTSVS